MKTIKITCLFFLLVLSNLALGQMVAPPVNPTASASSTEIAQIKAELLKKPDSLMLHQKYIRAMGLDNKQLTAQYDTWINQYPHKAIFPFAIGDQFCQLEMPQAKHYLLKATDEDPKLSAAWYDLSMDASRWGKEQEARQYLKMASEGAPSDPNYAFYYLDNERVQDSAHAKKVYEFVKKFPKSERSAQALYWLAERSTNVQDKINIFEKQLAMFPPDKHSWSQAGVKELWAIYIGTDPVKAGTIVSEIDTADKNGKKIVGFTNNMIIAGNLSAENKYVEALDVLKKTTSPTYPDMKGVLYLKQASLMDKLGDDSSAYRTVFSKLLLFPTDDLFNAAVFYGAKLSKTKKQVYEELKTSQANAAIPAPAFDLSLYTTTAKLRLADLKGKIILLTFWFPGCGPCRGEFPYFQDVINKYKKSDIAFIGINVLQSQDDYVLPFMNNTGYSFIPLRGNDQITKDYKVYGEPTNFLIDKEGKIVYSNFRTDGSSEGALEFMINSLL